MDIIFKFKSFLQVKPENNQQICYFSNKNTLYGVDTTFHFGKVELQLHELDDMGHFTGNMYFIDSIKELSEVDFPYKLYYSVNGFALDEHCYWAPENYISYKMLKTKNNRVDTVKKVLIMCSAGDVLLAKTRKSKKG